MEIMNEQLHSDLLAMTTTIVVAQIAVDRPDQDKLQGLIRTTFATLSGLKQADAKKELPDAALALVFEPATTIRKSLANPDFIISMIDGKPYKTLKRHIAGHELTPDEYRARYNLPADYPMTARAYSEKRRALAIQNGLGRKPDPAAPAVE